MRTLTIQVEENGRVAKKQFPLEPFQLMTPKVAAEGFLITVRGLQEELDRPTAKPETLKAEAPAPQPPDEDPAVKAAREWAEKKNNWKATKKKQVDAGAK